MDQKDDAYLLLSIPDHIWVTHILSRLGPHSLWNARLACRLFWRATISRAFSKASLYDFHAILRRDPEPRSFFKAFSALCQRISRAQCADENERDKGLYGLKYDCIEHYMARKILSIYLVLAGKVGIYKPIIIRDACKYNNIYAIMTMYKDFNFEMYSSGVDTQLKDLSPAASDLVAKKIMSLMPTQDYLINGSDLWRLTFAQDQLFNTPEFWQEYTRADLPNCYITKYNIGYIEKYRGISIIDHVNNFGDIDMDRSTMRKIIDIHGGRIKQSHVLSWISSADYDLLIEETLRHCPRFINKEVVDELFRQRKMGIALDLVVAFMRDNPSYTIPQISPNDMGCIYNSQYKAMIWRRMRPINRDMIDYLDSISEACAYVMAIWTLPPARRAQYEEIDKYVWDNFPILRLLSASQPGDDSALNGWDLYFDTIDDLQYIMYNRDCAEITEAEFRIMKLIIARMPGSDKIWAKMQKQFIKSELTRPLYVETYGVDDDVILEYILSRDIAKAWHYIKCAGNKEETTLARKERLLKEAVNLLLRRKDASINEEIIDINLALINEKWLERLGEGEVAELGMPDDIDYVIPAKKW